MDTYRGNFIDRGIGEDAPDYDFGEEETVREAPPSPVGQDERRMQVRAYNHWASLLDNRNFPSIEDLEPDNLPDFGPHSVLLDFTGGIENPAVQYLGDQLAAECGATDEIETLSDVPSRSLLSRITDHYMQILANQAPIGFEAEFVNQRERTILYRGILLPFSSDDDTIDFIYGVINWKELVDQQATDELLLEVDQALEQPPASEPRREEIIPDWADGPADGNVLDLGGFDAGDEDDEEEGGDLPEPGFGSLSGPASAPDAPLPEPGFASLAGALVPELTPTVTAKKPVLSQGYAAYDQGDEPLAATPSEPAPLDPAPLDLGTLDLGALAAGEPASDLSGDYGSDLGGEFSGVLAGELPDDMGLADWLASARELAQAAQGSEDRTRHALYAAIGRAYDFSLAAAEAPDEFAELVTDSGLTVQDRAPLIPVVKLVFGADYDKTRLTEYASALGHAHRIGLPRGDLSGYLGKVEGGLKGVVNEERRIRRGESGKPAEVRTTPREALARKLRRLETYPLDAVPADGSEFTLLVARRLPTGEVVLLGEVADDVAMLEKAARKLLGA